MLNSTSHPRAPWYTRFWNWLMAPELNPDSLEERSIQIMMGTAFIEAPPHGWDCFHCGDHFDPTFEGQRAAARHFGETPDEQPMCTVTAKQFRAMEDELTRYRGEDTELHRQINRMYGERTQAVRRAEEEGYARGLLVYAELDRMCRAEHGGIFHHPECAICDALAKL